MENKGDITTTQLFFIIVMAIMLLLVIVAIWQNWPRAVSPIKGILEKVGLLAPEAQEIISKEFGIMRKEEQIQTVINTLNNLDRCSPDKTNDENRKLITQYKTGINEIKNPKSKLDPTSQKTYSITFSERLLECYIQLGEFDNANTLTILSKSKILDALLSIDASKCIQNCDNLKSALTKILGEEPKDKIAEKFSLIQTQKKEIDEFKPNFDDFIKRLGLAGTKPNYEALKNHELLKKRLSGDLAIKVNSYKNFIQFEIDFLTGQNDCLSLSKSMEKYYNNNDYKNTFSVNKENGEIDKKKPLNLVASQKTADLCGEKQVGLYKNYFDLLSNPTYLNNQEKKIIKEKIEKSCDRFDEKLCGDSINTQICIPIITKEYRWFGNNIFEGCSSCLSLDKKWFGLQYISKSCSSISSPEICNSKPCGLNCAWDNSAKKCRG